MKKNNLFKVVGAVILGYVLLTWLLPIGLGIFGKTGVASYQAGLTSIGLVVVESFSGFGNVLVFVLLIGGFYGILKATGSYDALVNKTVEKFKGKEKACLIGIIVLLALVSSIGGLDLALFFVFPFIISVVLAFGYDKLVALVATFGATIIGMYGATFASTLYGVNNSILKTKATSEILAKVVLFVLGLGLLIAFTLLYIKNSKKVTVKKEHKSNKKVEAKGKKADSKKSNAKKTKVLKEENVKEEVKEEKKVNKNVKVWPALVAILATFLVFFVGTTAWGDIFGVNYLSNAHDAIKEFSIKGFAVVDKIFGGMDAMGTWNNPYRFQYYSVVLLFVSFIVSLIYRLKVKDAFEAFVEGVKEFIVPALLVMLACSMFVFVYYYPAMNYISNWFIGLSKDFNIAITGIYTIVNSIFYVDYYYFSYYVLSGLLTNFTDTSIYPLLNVMFTNLYSLVMLVAPTSVLLLASLSITGVSYKEWIKFIWKLFLSLLVVSFIVFAVLLLI